MNKTLPGRPIRKMFEGLPGSYELINHVITLGLDTSWRRRAAVLAASGAGSLWIDVSTGTGEMALSLRKLADPGVTIIATDFSMPMLRKARESATGIIFALADTGRLPFGAGSFDLVTTSFATRNVTTSREGLLSCIREFHRVLKPGGRLVNLETSQPETRFVKALFHGYARTILRPVGAIISGRWSAYSYLAGTMCSFYGAPEFAGIIREAGFETVETRKLFLGVAAIHVAQKGRPL